MRKIGTIHILNNRSLLQAMTRMSLAVLLAGCTGGILWFVGGVPELMGLPRSVITRYAASPALLGPLFTCILGYLASLALHELVHALLFKVFSPAGSKVRFGANWKTGMLYACAEGIVYTRHQYMAIVLAPSIVVTVVDAALGLLSGLPLCWYVVAVAHLSGCTGDWCYISVLHRNRLITHCEDTAWGVVFYGAGEEPDTVATGGEL